jgi:hypothetical protein
MFQGANRSLDGVLIAENENIQIYSDCSQHQDITVSEQRKKTHRENLVSVSWIDDKVTAKECTKPEDNFYNLAIIVKIGFFSHTKKI